MAQRASMPEATIEAGTSTPAIIENVTSGSSESVRPMRPDSRKQNPTSKPQKMPVCMAAFNDISH
jgi:hypothetical protein